MATWPSAGDLRASDLLVSEMKDLLEDWLALSKTNAGGYCDLVDTTISSAGHLVPGDKYYHRLKPYSGNSDDLTTIESVGCASGRFLVLCSDSDADTITIKHGTGDWPRISLEHAKDFVLDGGTKKILLHYEQSNNLWREIARSWGTPQDSAFATHHDVLAATNPAFTGTVTGPKTRLTETGNLELGTSNHAFQIGASNVGNLAMDRNDIMARNNGNASPLHLNRSGGIVTVGGTGNEIWHEGNDGPGSTLDADTVDGFHASVLIGGQYAWIYRLFCGGTMETLVDGGAGGVRQLAGEYDPTGIINSLTTNKIYPVAGTYRVKARSGAWAATQLAPLKYMTTIRINGSDHALYGHGAYRNTDDSVELTDNIAGYITIGAGHYIELAYALYYGAGSPQPAAYDHHAWSGKPQILSSVELWKIA